MTNWQEELSVRQPDPLEYANPHTFIQRRGITKYERTDAEGNVENGWKCESRFISVEEYYMLLSQEEMVQGTNENVLISMAAQADIYEKLMAQEENQFTIMAAIAEIYETQNGGI